MLQCRAIITCHWKGSIRARQMNFTRIIPTPYEFAEAAPVTQVRNESRRNFYAWIGLGQPRLTILNEGVSQ